MDALNALARVIKNEQLSDYLCSKTSIQNFDSFIEALVKARSDSLIDMYATIVGNGIGYFKSPDPMLRRNVICLVSHILCFTQENEHLKLEESLINTVINSMVDLLSEDDTSVQNASAKYLGMVMVSTSS